MKLNNLTIILILFIIYYYPDVVNKLTGTILGKIIMLLLLTMISFMDLLTGILLLFIVLLLHKTNNLESFDIIKNVDTSIKRKPYKEPFVTKSKDRLNIEHQLLNR
tara:strand:- start:733 stop:1050 length:318 start_codon:yes stop_codon:yes gene_type:complete